MSTNTATAELERELGKAIVKAVGRKDARRLLAAPNVLQSAVATAAAAWDAIGAKPGALLPRGDGGVAALNATTARQRLSAFIVDGDWDELWPDDELLTTDETAELIGKSQPTVLDWIKRDRIIGLTRKKRGFRIPREQFGKKGELIAGVKEILAILPDHNAAWSFLTEPYPFDSGLARPLDFIKKRKVEEALAAANSWGTDFS